MEKEVIYYYLKHEDGNPYGCVAFYENDDKTVNRGVSVCSLTDKFVKDKARGIALKRLMKAAELKKTVNFEKYRGVHPLRPSAFDGLIFDTKYGYHVPITEKEHRTLYKPER